MKNKELKQRLATAFENSTPNVLGQVQRRISESSDESNGTIVELDRSRHRRSPVRRLSAIAAVLIFAVGLTYGGVAWIAPSSSVAIDVNPSIELKLNSLERVVSCKTGNDAAVKILGEMDLRGSEVDVAVNALIGSMLINGYLDEMKNSVLITVAGSNGEQLQSKLSAEVSQLLGASIGESAVLSQTLSNDEELAALSAQYGISEGKASLIRSIVERDSHLTFEALAPLSVNELTLLSQDRLSTESGISTRGKASNKAYIGAQAARDIVLTQYPSAVISECELDFDDGRMVYDIEFLCDGVEYETELDALTGSVLKTDSQPLALGGYSRDDDDLDDDDNLDSDNDNDNDNDPDDDSDDDDKAVAAAVTALSAQQAQELALSRFGFTADDVSWLTAEKESENGKLIYCVEFRRLLKEYEVEVDANTGEILSASEE